MEQRGAICHAKFLEKRYLSCKVFEKSDDAKLEVKEIKRTIETRLGLELEFCSSSGTSRSRRMQ